MQLLTEPETREILRQTGVDTGLFRFARNKNEALRFSSEIGYPVVLKVVSPQISHKTDAGGVALNLNDAYAVDEAYKRITRAAIEYDHSAEVLGVLVTPYYPSGVEVIVGLSEDPQFGPVIMTGLGGVFVEVFRDVTFRIAPVTERVAADMLRSLKAFELLNGFRGTQLCDVDALALLISKVSSIPFNFPAVVPAPAKRKASVLDYVPLELDLNPVRVFEKGKGLAVLDARLVLRLA